VSGEAPGEQATPSLRRRGLLAAGALALAGCEAPRAIEGGFTGIAHERGHALREPGARPAPTVTRRVHTLIAGGGVAGLAAARALRLAGHDDFALLELEDEAGGNSRGGTLNGIACPLGAHYLPVPGDEASEVQDLLEELGLRRRVAGRWTYDERHLCHSPQERLFFQGHWQDGLLPLQGIGPATLAQYRRFAARVEALRRATRFSLPVTRAWTGRTPLSPVHQALDAITFEAWLAREGLDDPQLRWYLDYSCRDDYGAGLATVSAWAGLHYFASRHGFHAPGDEALGDGGEREAVLTWPEGNAWLTRRLAAPLGDRLRIGRTVLRIAETRQGVTVDALDSATGAVERWQAAHCIVALPLFVAARVVQDPPDFLRAAARRVPHAPWLVTNLHLNQPLQDRPGAAPAWDNVLYGSSGLGYVDAMHQRLQPVPGATVLTHYQALGDGHDARRALLQRPWTAWRDTVLAELSTAHPDLPAKVTRMALTRYGHAMAVPVPGTLGLLSQIGQQHPSGRRRALLNGEPIAVLPTPARGRLSFAHSDWSGYSVFEEAFTRGHHAGLRAGGR